MSQSPLGDLIDALMALRRTTQRLRVVGLSIFLSTILNLSIFVLAVVDPSKDRFIVVQLVLWVVLISACALAAIAFYEYTRKQGDILFEEISDELHWNLRSAKDGPVGAAPDDRPMIEIRIALRSFTRASDLPLVPGRFGPAIYALLHIAFMLLLALVFSPFKPFHIAS